VTTDDNVSAEASQQQDITLSAAMNVAMQWKDLEPAHLTAALSALEPSLKREHRERLARLEALHVSEERQYTERQQQREHKLHMATLITGATVALAMMAGGVYVAADAWWLSILLCGPSLLALAKVFVLKRSDPGDMDAVTRAGRTATNAAGQAQPPPPPAPPGV
jgi:hypothetical protein